MCMCTCDDGKWAKLIKSNVSLRMGMGTLKRLLAEHHRGFNGHYVITNGRYKEASWQGLLMFGSGTRICANCCLCFAYCCCLCWLWSVLPVMSFLCHLVLIHFFSNVTERYPLVISSQASLRAFTTGLCKTSVCDSLRQASLVIFRHPHLSLGFLPFPWLRELCWSALWGRQLRGMAERFY